MAWPSRCDRIFAAYPLAAGGIFFYQADLRAVVAAGPSFSKESIVKFQKHSSLTISQGMSSLERMIRDTRPVKKNCNSALNRRRSHCRAFVACGPPYESEN